MTSRKHMLWVGTLLFSLWSAVRIFAADIRIVNNLADARATMQEFLRRSGKSIDKYDISIYDHPGLLKKTYLASISEKNNFDPCLPSRYVISGDGKIAALDLEQLVIAYVKEKVAVSSDLTVETIAKSLIHLADEEGPVPISRLEDIPGYNKRPLDSDVEAVVRAPWQFTDKDGNVYWICITYTQNQGIVRRYKFVFRHGLVGNPVEVIQLGRDIGDFVYPR